MNRSFGKTRHGLLAALILVCFVMSTVAEAQRGGGRGGGGGGGRGGGGGGGGSAARQNAQVNNSRADARTNNVRSTSVNNVNNVNVQRNVNVNVENGGCCGGWDHPVAAAAAVGATVAVTSAVIGSMVQTVPAGCVPVNYGGMVYQQCGGTWYAPSGAQYIVVSPPY